MPKSILKSRKLRKFFFNTSSSLKKKTRSHSSKNATVSLDETIEKQSYKIINLAGYAILALVFLDYLALLIPPKLFNPAWEIETIGKGVETVWGPLLGLILIFYRRQKYSLKRSELKLLALFSRLALILGVVYLLAAPLLITDTFRIMRKHYAQMTFQLESQNNKIQQLDRQLQQASDDQLKTFWQRYQGRSPEISTTPPHVIKQKILQKIEQEKQQTKENLERDFATKKLSMGKTTIKWLLGTLVAGISFITIWNYTKWTRAIGQ